MQVPFVVAVDEDAKPGTYGMEVKVRYKYTEEVDAQQSSTGGQPSYDYETDTRTETLNVRVSIEERARFEILMSQALSEYGTDLEEGRVRARIDYPQGFQLKEEIDRLDVLRDAGAARFRPILLTSLTTFFAVRYAASPADLEHRYGHGKAEAFTTLTRKGKRGCNIRPALAHDALERACAFLEVLSVTTSDYDALFEAAVRRISSRSRARHRNDAATLWFSGSR